MHSKCKDTLSRLHDAIVSLRDIDTSSQPRWQFYNTIEEASCAIELQNIGSTLDVLHCMKAEWRNERLELPNAWAPLASPLQTRNSFIPDHSISLMTAPIRSKIDVLTNDRLLDRHNSMSVRPDFCLSKYRISRHTQQPISSMSVKLQRSPKDLVAPCSTVVSDLMMYTGNESVAAYAISGPFTGIPGCWFTKATNTYLPDLITVPLPTLDLEFVVLPHPRSSSSPSSISRDALLSITLTHPALFLAMKGPSPWEKSLRAPTTLRDMVRALSGHAQSSLEVLRLTWCFCHDNATSSPPLLSEDIVFGMLYDSMEVCLVAHFWTSDSDLVSVIVDTLDFPSDIDPDTVDFPAWSENRVRLILALLTMQRHTFRLASLWDDVHFPEDISRLSSQLDTIIMGPEQMPYKQDSFQASEDSDYSEDEYSSIACNDCCKNAEPLCIHREDENKAITKSFMLSEQRVAVDAWRANTVPRGIAQYIAAGYDDVDDAALSPDNNATSSDTTLKAPFWIFYDYQERDPLRYQDDHPSFWSDTINCVVDDLFFILAVPESWLCNELEKSASLDTDITSMAYALNLFSKSMMSYVHDRMGIGFKVEIANAADLGGNTSPSPMPMLTINELPSTHPQSLKSALLALFAYSCPLSYERRLMDVMIPTLSGFFYVPGCRVSHLFPQTSDAIFEDVLESRVIIEGLPEIHWPSLIVAMPWDARPLAEGSASLTKYLERSLHVLTTLYEQTPNANPALLPQWCVLIGMVYTANGFRLYAHYPLWNEGEGRWDYVSVQISEIHDGSFSTSSIVYSFLTARALLCVQRHALEVQTQLNGWIRDYGHVLTTLNV